MPRYEAILFDFDGVLVDSEPVHYACWADIVRPFRVRLDWETYRRHCIGLHDREVVQLLCGLKEPPLSAGDLWAHYPRKQDLFLRRMTARPPFPNFTIELLNSLSSYKLAVVTSSQRCEVEPILDAGGIRSLFAAVVSAEDVTRHKPAPDPYLFTARLLRVNSALVVEDSDAGVESARAAGFDVLRVSQASETAARLSAKLSAQP